jgi:hypothetical protein
VVQLGLKLAFHAGQELTIDHLLAAIPEIRPLSKTDPESVTAMTKWLDITPSRPATATRTSPVNGSARKRACDRLIVRSLSFRLNL